MKKPLGVAGKAVIRQSGNGLLLQRSLANEFIPGIVFSVEQQIKA
jgi:hypothetical protein